MKWDLQGYPARAIGGDFDAHKIGLFIARIIERNADAQAQIANQWEGMAWINSQRCQDRIDFA